MTATNKRSLLILATLLVWGAAGAVTLKGVKFSARAPVTVQLATRPSAVRLTIDGERFENGAYVRTPLALPLAPGRRRVKIGREGYVAHVMTVEGSSGETFLMEDVVLQPLEDVRFVRVEVQVQAGKPQWVEIDDGHDSGEAPIATDDIEAGRQHLVSVYPAWPEREPHFSCRFTPPVPPLPPSALPTTEDGAPPPQADEAPYKIRIIKDKKRFTATGCLAVKAKKQ